jgi:mycothiol synthase
MGSGLTTLVPTQVIDSGLVEVATETPENYGDTWFELKEAVMDAARAVGMVQLEVIARGGLIEDVETTMTGGVRRMKLADAVVGHEPTTDRYIPDDFEDLLAAINEAFEGHSENGNWTVADLSSRFELPWFDPAGLLVLRSAGEFTGFCWCKIHPDRVGEIYLVGVTRRHRGRGLGKDLLESGLAYLSGQGCSEIIVYTEVGNTEAEKLYRSVGFISDRVDRRLKIAL